MNTDWTRNVTFSCPTGQGRIVDMICREEDVLQIRFDAFRNEWTRRVRFHAAVALNRFREALARHIRWEEESLFEEYEKRCLESELAKVRSHHQEHERMIGLAARIDEEIAETMAPNSDPALEAEIDAQVAELARALTAHRQIELHEVGCWLDKALTDAQIDEIATELEERGRPLS